jgi:hypothetical protein
LPGLESPEPQGLQCLSASVLQTDESQKGVKGVKGVKPKLASSRDLPDWSRLMTEALTELRGAEEHFRLIHMSLEPELLAAKQHLLNAQIKLLDLQEWANCSAGRAKYSESA